MSVQSHHKEQFDKSSDEELKSVVKSFGIDRPEGAYCLMLLQQRFLERSESHLQTLTKPHWVVTLTLIFTALCFVASSIAAWPIVKAWLLGSP